MALGGTIAVGPMVYFVHLVHLGPARSVRSLNVSAALVGESRQRREGVRTEPAEPLPLTTTTSPPTSLLMLVPAVAAPGVSPVAVAPSDVPPASVPVASPVTLPVAASARQGGEATWLNTIPSGTCANNGAPIGTTITVTSSSGATVVCKVVSRGPYGAGKIVDLAEGTFAELAPPSQGVVGVRVRW
jgi:hypothetical protein